MRALGVYKSYSFRTKDPVIDQLRTVVKDEGVSYQQLADASGVSAGTMWNWFHGATRRPQHASVMAVTRAMGYDYELVKSGKSLVVARPGLAKVGHNSKRKGNGK
jgi:transcriptional regulator with XRE-family HTH domain